MALNQVIHGSNRVVENPNRYKLNAVSGQANTYDLEKMPGVITDNGTPYNKILLDKMDNVLSYLTPSFEYNTPPVSETIDEYLPNNVAENYVYNYLPLDETHIPQMRLSTDAPNGFRLASSTSSNYITLRPQLSGSYNYSQEAILNIFQKITPNSTTYLRQEYGSSTDNYKFIIDIDFKTLIRSATFESRFTTANDSKLYTSTDGITYNLIETLPVSTTTRQITNFRYVKVEFQRTGTGSLLGNLNYISFYDVKYVLGGNIIYYTLDNNYSFTNNQRILINVDSSAITDNVENNYLNNIPINTKLLSNKYYELVYKENENKFIAEEVLNAN